MTQLQTTGMGVEQERGAAGQLEDDFVVTATRPESERRLKVPGEVPAIGKMSFEVARLRSELKNKEYAVTSFS